MINVFFFGFATSKNKKPGKEEGEIFLNQKIGKDFNFASFWGYVNDNLLDWNLLQDG